MVIMINASKQKIKICADSMIKNFQGRKCQNKKHHASVCQ